MPSDRRARFRSRSRSREDSESREAIRLPHDASTISESDYFRKGDEFRIWLKTEKKKYFDELSGDKARSYFRKFVKAWNKGKLSKSLYAGVDPSTISAESQTGYKWSFASNRSRVDNDALRAAREQVGAATYGREGASTSGPPGPGRIQGPTLPSSSDLVLARELTRETEQEERSLKRKRDRAEAKEHIEDMVGPREVGREGALEKKRARREADRTFRDRGDDGFEADESVLLGGGDSFRDQIAKRDAARKRFEQKSGKEDKAVAVRERANVYKEKESATIAMFQALAKQRFG
ncbi:hypothetical protein DFH07DRAFT_822804 [Mycena maculata]|uniref:Splicing arginine serine-rich 12 n=1 Tax=Mycena maculata TaxID=230809 RepID=A0AAD7J1J1_9AGAR|nr:hypothetical protein DFH07DRAFT_822804 [Mycena maculata]